MRTLRITSGSWLTIAFAAGVSSLLWASFGLSRASAWFPQWVLSITLALLVLQLGGELLASRATGEQIGAHPADGRGGRAVAAIAWLIALVLLTGMLGSAVGGAVFCCAWLRGHAGERWPVSLAIAAGLGITLWLLFAAFLGMELYTGLL